MPEIVADERGLVVLVLCEELATAPMSGSALERPHLQRALAEALIHRYDHSQSPVVLTSDLLAVDPDRAPPVVYIGLRSRSWHKQNTNPIASIPACPIYLAQPSCRTGERGIALGTERPLPESVGP
jgi:hypothetical protein